MLFSKGSFAHASASQLYLTHLAMVQGHEFSRAATVLKLLQETPASEAEWILYMDPQTVFDAPTVLFNFEFYAGRDIVLACNIWMLKAGDTGEPGCTSMAWVRWLESEPGQHCTQMLTGQCPF